MISNQVTITVSQCNCPSAEVCMVNGQCPANTFPDEYNPGCCIPCSQLIPANITDITIADTPVFYYMNIYDNSVHPSCSSCLNNCKTNNVQFSVPVSGKVVDSAGHGICNAQVNITPSNYGQAYITVDYSGVCGVFSCNASVTWLIELGSASAYTDSNGNFSTYLGVSASVYQSQIPIGLTYGCYNSPPQSANFIVNFNVAGTNVSGIGTAVVIFNSAISKPL